MQSIDGDVYGCCSWRVEREQREWEIDSLSEAVEGKEEEQQLLKEENEKLKVRVILNM